MTSIVKNRTLVKRVWALLCNTCRRGARGAEVGHTRQGRGRSGNWPSYRDGGACSRKTRPAGAGIDIGAYEAKPTYRVYLPLVMR